MHWKIVLLILALLALKCRSAEWIGVYYNKDFPGKCAITPQLVLNEGVTINDPYACRLIACGFNGTAIFQSCGTIGGLPKHCRFGDYANRELPYPRCCERTVICPKKYFNEIKK